MYPPARYWLLVGWDLGAAGESVLEFKMVFWAPPPEKNPAAGESVLEFPQPHPAQIFFISSRLLCRMYIYYIEKATPPPPHPSPPSPLGVAQGFGRIWQSAGEWAHSVQCRGNSAHTPGFWEVSERKLKIFKKNKKNIPHPPYPPCGGPTVGSGPG